MNFKWNVTISWLLLQFLVPAHSYQNEVTFPISSPSITLQCENELRVNNIEVAIRQRNTTCSTTIADCTLPNDAIATIKGECNKQVSCDVDIHGFTNNQICLHEYGYFNIWYTCKIILDYSCDFESHLCNWTFVQTNDRFQWKRGLRKTPKKPTIDHTRASTDGKYAYILEDESEENDFAKLESGFIVGTEQQCLSFWYYTTNTRDVVNIYQNDENLHGLSGYKEQTWHHIHIPLNNSNTLFKLVFIVVRGKKFRSNHYGAIVIDDILIENRNCNPSLRECDFDIHMCDINNEHSSKYIWRKTNGNNNPFHPETDHTTASKSGYYMYLSIGVSIANETTAYLEFQNIEMDILVNSCFTFWYFMFGFKGKGGLKVSLDDEHVWEKLEDKDYKWVKVMLDVSKRHLNNIKFIGIIGIGWEGDIAIDDIYITEGTCKGLFDHEKICVLLDDEVPKETFCPRGYLEFKNPLLSFDPEKEECSEAYDQTNMRILQECNYRNDSEKCLIDMSTDISSHPECFQVYELQILHTCEEEEITTVLPDFTSKRDSSAGEQTTTILSDATSEEDLSTVRDGSVNLPRAIGNSSKTATGLIVGVVVGALLLSCVAILVVVLIRRHTLKSKPSEIIRNNIWENDYIGSQDIALSCLPPTANRSKHMLKYGIHNEGSDTCLHDYDSKNENAHSNNIQQEYTNLGAFKGFVNQEKDQVPTHAHRQDKTFANNPMVNDDEYAIVDPTFETSFNETTDNRTGTADSYMVLDPTQTGFNRQVVSNTHVGYEFAKPVNNTENEIDDDDQYAISDGVYDHSGNNRHKESDNNIYNHTVDTIYDSGIHKRNDEEREDTYDHFFGQTTEDDYNISTTS